MRRVISAVAVAAAILISGLVTVAAPASAAPASGECESQDNYVQNIEGAWMQASGASPYQVMATKTGAKTEWCDINVSGNIWKFEQYQTYRCLTIDPTSGILETGDCSTADAEWNVISSAYAVGSTPYILLQDWGNKDCAYQDGLDEPVSYGPCVNQVGTTGDVWLLVS